MSDLDTPNAIVRSDLQHVKKKDAYCYLCEDGGDIIECNDCTNACCYNVIGERESNPTDGPEACVSLPYSMANGGAEPFLCPNCISDRGASSIGYFINQGVRVTMRLAPRTSVAIVIYHLIAYESIAVALSEQITAALSSFFVPVACQTRLIHRGFSEQEADLLFDEIPRDTPYHLAVIFLTEGDPQGGWWHTINHGRMKNSSVSEKDFLGTCLLNLKGLARGAATARVFGVACGYTLQTPGSIDRILRYMNVTAFRSLVMPSTCALLMCDYLPMFSELFLNLYYFGSSFEPSIIRIWCKSREVRAHTGLVIMARSTLESDLHVKMVAFAPLSSRPLGVPLPLVHTVCGCPEDRAKWNYRSQVQNAIETIFVYRAECCRLHLQVAIYPDRRQERDEHEVKYVVEPWNADRRCFTFNESANVCFKIFSADPKGKGPKVDDSALWTAAGRRALRRETKKMHTKDK